MMWSAGGGLSGGGERRGIERVHAKEKRTRLHTGVPLFQ